MQLLPPAVILFWVAHRYRTANLGDDPILFSMQTSHDEKLNLEFSRKVIHRQLRFAKHFALSYICTHSAQTIIDPMSSTASLPTYFEVSCPISSGSKCKTLIIKMNFARQPMFLTYSITGQYHVCENKAATQMCSTWSAEPCTTSRFPHWRKNDKHSQTWLDLPKTKAHAL